MLSKNIRIGLAAVLVLFALPSLALAELGFLPPCGAEGDRVLITGEDFPENPTVTFDGVEAGILRSNEERILCVVPDDTTIGAVDVVVDGTLIDEEFIVLTDGAPVVYRQSTEVATPGTTVLLTGLRLAGGEVDFLDPSGASQATVELRGRRRVVAFTVPGDLAPGLYTLKITNAEGISSGVCSPHLEVGLPGDPEITAIEPEEQLPGRHVSILGTDLSPFGPCRVVWTDGNGNELVECGHSNGYGRVDSRVPPEAEGGLLYEVGVVLQDGEETNTLVYLVGTPGAPTIEELRPDTGPAGLLIVIRGDNLLVGEMPEVRFGDVEARVVRGQPRRHRHDRPTDVVDGLDQLHVIVPPDLSDGEYDVTVTVGDQVSDPAVFTVRAEELSVEWLRPDTAGDRVRLIHIRGTGFGLTGDGELAVTFDDGSGGEPLAGTVVFRSHHDLLVAPPGGWRDPLPPGVYQVRVRRESGSVAAGTYTVE